MSSPEYIQSIVHNFYAKATTDVIIGFLFRGIDMDEHLPRITNFWRMQLLGETGLEEKPFNLIQAHDYLNLKRGQVDRWVVLFKQTLEESNGDQNFIKQWEEKITAFRSRFP